MKNAIILSLAAVLFWSALSALAAGTAGAAAPNSLQETVLTSTAQQDGGADKYGSAQPAPDSRADEEITVTVSVSGTDRQLPLRDYLTGVLLAELPGNFAPEAVKAQAVASRTYALRAMEHPKHGRAAVCTDSACCQAWVEPGTVPAAERAWAEAAVLATDGLVLRSGGRLIEATFFSCSGGRTESAQAVWGRDLPYLQPVDSPGEEEAAHFLDEARFPLTDFCALLRKADPEVDFSGGLGGWVGEMTQTPGGGVEQISLGGRTFTGKQLRSLFGLRSTAFTLELTATEAVFTTRGYGHRVGLSQWGAQAMAEAGKDFREILTHYYQGVSVEAYGK